MLSGAGMHCLGAWPWDPTDMLHRSAQECAACYLLLWLLLKLRPFRGSTEGPCTVVLPL